jgi:Tfp pilus assembly protein PilV
MPIFSGMRRLLTVAARCARDSGGFALIEVLAAVVVLAVGLGASFKMLNAAEHATSTDRIRQAQSSVARELTEDTRSLAYSQLTATAIASALQSLVPGSTASGASLTVSRSIYTFTATFTSCSMDDPADGLGVHTSAPDSGGSWCTDVGSSGTADAQPDDYKRASVTVAPASGRTTPTVQQSVLIYNRTIHGPAVSCLSVNTTCPGTNQTYTTGTQLTFNDTTTTPAASVSWLVNGSRPTSSQLTTGEDDPYSPNASATSTFTWVFPNADGTYTISAQAFDAQGNSGTKSSLQITLNLHQAVPPATVYAGYNSQIGGVDVSWTPSIDQDVLYYDVYRQYGSGSTVEVCAAVHGTNCTDTTASSPGTEPTTCTSSSQSFTTADRYWVVGVDTNSATGQPRESTSRSTAVDANLCDHPPSAPTSLAGTLSGGQMTLSWTAPTDPDSWDSVQFWRIYRWTGTGPGYPANRYGLIGTFGASGNAVTTYTDSSADPGGVAQNYCVTAVDTHMNESPCSNGVSG